VARKTRGQQQPRALEDLTIRPHYRAGMHTELQKFGQKDETIQLMLGEDTSLQDMREVEVFGLDLSVSEDKALSAIQILLDQTDYQGNIPGETVSSPDYRFEGYLPKLSITYSDYYEAYGLSRIDGRYQGRQAKEALKALKSLAETRKICYTRTRYTGKGKTKKKVNDVIRVTRPLIGIMEGFKDLDDEEKNKVIAGEDLPEKRQTKLVLEISPLMVDQLDTFYLLKPKALHDEIQALLPGKRISRPISLFLEWLLTVDKRIIKISKDNLANKLRMDGYIRQRKIKVIEDKIQEALEVAKDLDYLLDYKEEPIGLLVLTLNPERCQRIRAKNNRRQDEENSSLAQ
jgi:hypothetical protein